MLARVYLGIGRYEVNPPYYTLGQELVASMGVNLKVDITAIEQLKR